MSKPIQDREVRPFLQVLHEQRNGLLASELSDSLNELVEAVSDTGKAGSVTLTISIKAAGRGAGMVTVTDEVRVKLPQADKQQAIYFVSPDFNLLRNNPNQPELPFREVPRPETEIREVNR